MVIHFTHTLCLVLTKDILWSRDILDKGILWKVGNGKSIDAQNDVWIPDIQSGRITPTTLNESIVKIDTLITNDGNWDMDKLGSIFLPYEVEAIKRIPIAGSNYQDNRFWHFDKKGIYSVKSGYWNSISDKNLSQAPANAGMGFSSKDSFWNNVWALNILKIFIGKVAHDIIASEANLIRYHVPRNPKCVLCGFHWVDTSHSILFCQEVKGAWKNQLWWSTIKKLKGSTAKDILSYMCNLLSR